MVAWSCTAVGLAIATLSGVGWAGEAKVKPTKAAPATASSAATKNAAANTSDAKADDAENTTDTPNVVQARDALLAEHAARLEKLAAWCDEQNLPELANRTRAWLPKRDPLKLYLFDLPASRAAEAATMLADGSQPPAEWLDQFYQLRDAQADALFALAKRAIKESRASLAYELVGEAARENPDHKQARSLLGYVKFRDAWQTPFEVKQLSAGKVWHEKFGWLLKSHAERYDAGERFYKGRWLSAADEAKLRSDMARGWRVESEHYSVTTNHSLEEGVKLSQRLEKLYRIWQQVFVRYLASEADLARRLEGKGTRPRDARQLNVVYYRTRDEYNRALEPLQPRIAITLGIYFDTSQTAYFFAGEAQEPGTLYHEATHQLFQETRPVAKEVGRRDNFWIIEAIACYMESLDEQPGYVTLGGADAGRVPAARQRLLVDKYYMPLTELSALGLTALQESGELSKLYSQSAGLALFLMHGREGHHREALMAYLDAVYSGKAKPQTLAALTAASYAELDAEYRVFLEGLPDNASDEPQPPTETKKNEE